MRRVILTDRGGREIGPPTLEREIDRALRGIAFDLSRDLWGDGGPLVVLTVGGRAPALPRPVNRLSGLAAWLPYSGKRP